MIQYNEDWLLSLLFHTKGSVGGKAAYWALPATIIAYILISLDEWSPDFREDYGLLDLNKSQLWGATTGILAMLLSFRTNRAMARFWEGTGLLHQMRGEWFDSISCCVTFSIGAMATKKKEVYRFRHTIVRLMSLCHGSALEEIAGGKECVATIDSMGLDNNTLNHLKRCKEVLEFNRVEVLLHMTQSIITKALDDGILKIPPPILSRVYQTLSRGFVNLLNAKKIADTRFPFPYAQLIILLLFIQTFLTPLMITSLVKTKLWACIFTFVPIFAMFSVNYVGVELENPFGTDDNDLPLAHFQSEMNKCLMMLLHDSADLIADVSADRCITDFETLQEKMNESHVERASLTMEERQRGRKSISDFMLYVEDRHTVKQPVEPDEIHDIHPRNSNTSFLSPATSAEKAPVGSMVDIRMSEKPPDESMVSPTMEASPVDCNAVVSRATSPCEQEGTPLERENSSPEVKVDYAPIVETQVQALSRSIAALTEFIDSLPGTLDQAIMNVAADGSSKWRTQMLKRASNGYQGSPSNALLALPQDAAEISGVLSDPLGGHQINIADELQSPEGATPADTDARGGGARRMDVSGSTA